MQNSTPAPPTNSTSGKAMERGPTVRSIFDGLSAEDFQRHGNDHPLYLEVAAWARALNDADNLGLVVGATHPDDLARVRQTAPDLPFLIPGVGAQGGALEPAVTCGTPDYPSIINVSRGIVYAGEGSLDEISASVEDYNRRINKLAQSHGL